VSLSMRRDLGRGYAPPQKIFGFLNLEMACFGGF